MLVLNISKRNKTHPVPALLEYVFRNVAPGIPLLIEYPLGPKDPTGVRILGEIPVLLIFRPIPLPRFILF